MASEPTRSEVVRMPLRALGLKSGMALQTRRLVEGASKKESQYVGAIEGKGVMVGPLGPEGTSTGLVEGEICVVRGFTGQYEYSFLTKVLQTFEQPFIYALLAYPAQVDAQMVRQSLRTKVSWPTCIRVGSEEIDVSLIDLSIAGAMIKTNESVVAVGQSILVSMDVVAEGVAVRLDLHALVCHSNRAKEEDAYFVGVAFKGVGQEEKMILHYLTQASPQSTGRSEFK
jgi:c-di-GMP-binding flagellar brake protein YcgR